MTKTPAMIGRLALRIEGQWWNAYWVPQMWSMEGALHLGSVLMTLVERSPKAKAAFMEAMQIAFAQAVKDAIGVEPSWPNAPEPAPEAERSGRA